MKASNRGLGPLSFHHSRFHRVSGALFRIVPPAELEVLICTPCRSDGTTGFRSLGFGALGLGFRALGLWFWVSALG